MALTMLRLLLRRRARRLDEYWQTLSGHDAPTATPLPPPPAGLPADLAAQTRWLHRVSQSITLPNPPTTEPTLDTPAHRWAHGQQQPASQ